MEQTENFVKKFINPFDEDENCEVFVIKKIASTHNGMIQIWLVKYENNQYALKQIARKSLDCQQKIDHIYNERQALQNLEHPVLNPLKRTLKDDENLYFLLEMAYGCTFDHLIKANQKLTVNFTRFVTAQMIRGLEYMHSEGYVYRDIKLTNCIVNVNGKLQIIDFGFTKKINQDRTNSICGTLHAMAPEIINNKEYSFEIDIYSLGIFIFELVTGHAPFGYELQQSENKDLKEKIILGVDDQILNEVEDINLRNMIKDMLEIDPLKRPKISDLLTNYEFFKQDFDLQELDDFIIDAERTVNFSTDLKFYEDDIALFGILQERENDDIITKEIQNKFDTMFN